MSVGGTTAIIVHLRNEMYENHGCALINRQKVGEIGQKAGIERKRRRHNRQNRASEK